MYSMLKPILIKLAHLPLITVAVTVLLISIQSQSIHGYENGAPGRVCEEMKPGHGEQSMSTSKLPFTITLDKRFIRGTGKINIKVTSENPSRFTLAGVLFVMKRPNNKGRAYGSFVPKPSDKELKTVDCFGREGSRSGITHVDNRKKTSLSFQWIAPNDTSAEYELHATLVRDFNTYWADYIYPHKIRVSVDAPASSTGSTTKNTFIFTAALVLLLFNCLHYT